MLEWKLRVPLTRLPRHKAGVATLSPSGRGKITQEADSVPTRLAGLICAPAMLALAAIGRTADTDACLAQCRTVYEACWRAAVTYEGYMACYRRANACSEGCSAPRQPR